MACENTVGVKNILMTFEDCNENVRIGPIAHLLAAEDLPTWKTCAWTNERLPGGYIRRTSADARVTINVIRDLRIPLAFYQGCAAIDLQVEMDNGLVYTGKKGGVIGDQNSDSHAVELDITFKFVDELLPQGAIAA